MEKQNNSGHHLLSEGILLVDKPTGVSSHTVVNWARKLSGIRKIGHTGTLDPLATGLLILLIGKKYTRMQEQYLKLDKEYICTAQLGLTTDSYDCDGKIVSQVDPGELSAISREAIDSLLPEFTGEIIQTVPGFSAVRVGGRKLYALMREAENSKTDSSRIIENLPKRQVQIYDLELLEFSSDTTVSSSALVTVSLRVRCSSGTYIRSLVHDIGQKLGVGATVIALRRTQIGELSIDQALMCPLIQKR